MEKLERQGGELHSARVGRGSSMPNLRGKRPKLRLNQTGMTYTQVFLLVVGFGVSSMLIFLFGMWVGRDRAERDLAHFENIVRVPVPFQPAAAPDGGKEEDSPDAAFYQRLRDKAEKRLQQEVKESPPAEPTPTSSASVFIVPTRTIPQPMWPTSSEQRVYTPTARNTPRPTNSPRPRPTTPARQADADVWADAGWTVQVTATTDPTEARDLAQRLRARGFDAYMAPAPTRGGPTWYRVRVGRFGGGEKERARDLEDRLRADGMSNARVMPQ